MQNILLGKNKQTPFDRNLKNKSCFSESEQFKFEKEISASRQQLQTTTESCTKLKLQIAELGNLYFI